MPLRLLTKVKNSKFKETLKKNRYIMAIVLAMIVITVTLCLILSNDGFYKKTIAKVTVVSEKTSQVSDVNGNLEEVKDQQLKAVIMNGVYKGKEIQLQNTVSYSEVNDFDLKIGDKVFISIKEDLKNKSKEYKIIDFKRDTYIVYISALFIILILIIGGFKGFRSLISLIINIIIFSIVIELFSRKINLTLLCIIASILFINLSILIVSGKNKKAFSAITATIAGTIISVLIAVLVIQMNNWSGMHTEEMEFLTHPPKQIFFMEILIGTLGGIMDIAISISSSLYEIYDKNPCIEIKALIKSGISIGKDIMGTMSNTLVFAYVSGSIPMILLVMKNNYPISYIVNINLSLEIIRALTGSIGIVLSIPITIFTSVMFIKNYRIGELK